MAYQTAPSCYSCYSLPTDDTSRIKATKVYASYNGPKHFCEGRFEELEDSPAKLEPTVQKEEMTKLLGSAMNAVVDMNVGDVWYVVDSYWWQDWKGFTGYEHCDGEKGIPGALVNSGLISFDRDKLPELRMDALEREDFVILPEKAYTHIMEWYGGGPHIPRTVVKIGSALRVAVRLEYRKGYVYNSEPDRKWFAYSLVETVSAVVKLVCVHSF
jgi:hypothetical protein